MGILKDSGLRFGIFGLGHWHAEYYRKILAGDSVSIVAATDRNLDAGIRKARLWDIPFESDLDDMIARYRPDFLFVLPRHDQACADIERAVATKLPLLIEKPFGLNAVEAQRAAEAAEAAAVFADTCLPNRHMDIWNACRELDALPAKGGLRYAHFRMNNGPAGRYFDYDVPWMLEKNLSGGGALRNLGYHGADAALFVARDCSLEIESSRMRILPGTEIEFYAAATLFTEDGAIITLEAGYATASNTGIDHEWRISTEEAFLCQQNGRLVVQGKSDANPRLVVENDHEVFYDRMVRESVRALVQDRPPHAPIQEAARAAALIDAIYERAQA